MEAWSGKRFITFIARGSGFGDNLSDILKMRRQVTHKLMLDVSPLKSPTPVNSLKIIEIMAAKYRLQRKRVRLLKTP